MNIGDILAGANVILALIAGLFSLRWCIRFGRSKQFWWLKMLIVLIAFYWSGLYLFVLLTPAGRYDSIWFGQTFVRPAFTFTLSIMAASAVQRCKAG